MKKVLLFIFVILLTGCTMKTDKKEDYTDVEEFLKSGLISTSDAVGAGYPSGYVFKEDHTFSYFVGEYETIEVNSLVSCRGTWEIKNNNLVLTVLEDEHNNNPDDIWDNIDKREQKYEVILKNIRLNEKDSIKYLTTSEWEFYSLQVEEDYMEILYSLCNSYDEFYEVKNLYYTTI